MREPRQATPGDTASRKTGVLVVDDEVALQNLLRSVLERAGYRVIAAATADEALAALPDDDIALAIVDIHLRDSDGMELCRRLRQAHCIEIILITGDEQNYSYEDAIRSGACDFVLKPINSRELLLRSERAIQARRIRAERDRSIRELQILSTTDSLTGLYNSRHLFVQLSSEIERAQRHGRAVSLLLLDLDHFKRHNDTHGHQDGDRVLRRIGEILRAGIRGSDSAYRYGGEEFIVILPETNREAAGIAAGRLVAAIASAEFPCADGSLARVTCSIGVAQWCDGESSNAFLRRVDFAMYEFKRRGRNCLTVAPDGGPDVQTISLPAVAPHGNRRGSFSLASAGGFEPVSGAATERTPRSEHQ